MNPLNKKYTVEEAAELIMAEDSDFDDMDEGESASTESHQHDVEVVPEITAKFDLVDIVMLNVDLNEEETMVLEEVELIDTRFAELTKKTDITWRKRPFNNLPFDFEWSNLSSSDYIESPFEIFSKYIPISMYAEIASYTNQYAIQSGSGNFKHASPEEISQLFGMHIIMGVLGFPQVRMYWNQYLELQSISKVMTRDRFFWLRSNLHFMDNNTIPTNCQDKFIKIRPLINVIKKRCHEMPMEESLSIDEQMIPFKGHLGIKQYMRGKPKPWGIKVFVLCGKSGYPYDFVLYQGKTTEIDLFDRSSLGFGAAVITHLIQRIKKPGHSIFFDNYFSSYQIFEILSQKQLNAAGTIRVNRFNSPKFSNDAEMKRKGRGSSEELTSRDGKIVLVKWQDNRSVHLASNFVSKGSERLIKRWDKNAKAYVEIMQPEIVEKYNESMGGVDLLDQYMSYYRIFIKSRKWTLRVIFHFIDFAVCASYLEYRRNCEMQKVAEKHILKLKDFKLKLGWCLTKVSLKKSTNNKRKYEETFVTTSSPTTTVRSTEVRPETDIRFDGVDHLPLFQQSHSASRCKNPICKGSSRVFCTKCKVHLCLNSKNNCFYNFHSK